MKQVVGAQGEVTIFKVDSLPEGLVSSSTERVAKGWIISHSESGHHHILTGGVVMERPSKSGAAGVKTLYAILDAPAEFVQDAPVPHEKFSLPAGLYEFRLAREFDPFAEQVRQVRD